EENERLAGIVREQEVTATALADARQRIERLTEQRNELGTRLASMQAARDSDHVAFVAERDQLNATVGNLETELAAAENAAGQSGELRRQLRENRDALSAAQTELERLTGEATALSEQVAALQNGRAAEREQLSRNVDELTAR